MFTWRDGERLIRFGPLAPVDEPYVLLTTERVALAEFVAAATEVVHVPPGRVDEISAGLLGRGSFEPDLLLVALGGGRVVDTGKAIAGAIGGRCAAIPTTLSGAEMTPFHRTPAGVEGARLVRPALVLADPDLMTSAPPQTLAASAMNALAHAMEALYTPLANPVASMAALRAASLLPSDDREHLALGALLAGYASGLTGIAVHHAVCQTLVRMCGTPHAETNAVMLPHSARLMEGRAPEAVREFRAAVAPHDLSALAARSGHTRLGSLGVEEQRLPEVAEAVAAHPLLGNTPNPPGAEELLALLRAAL
ncbi:MAG: maleylacetate reductase [Thermoleophilaceae bacterium]|nr:maleylacetate reductase [Thermoleophilaceae bacterium]